jgi:hemerythrin-like domain-containing protein
MIATEILMAEHRVIEQVLDSLDAAAERLARGEAIRPGFFADVADFASRFADGCHHQKEEGVLFPARAQHGVPAEGGPIEIMLHEHEAGRTYVRQLREAARLLEGGNASAARQVIAAAKGYSALLRDHITKEDEMLFPMAAEMIPEAKLEQIATGFDHIEHAHTGPNAHAELLALARRLQAEVAP